MSAKSFDWSAKVVEPEKRLFEGRYGYAVHRFPIKNGLSLSVVLADQIGQIAPTQTPFLSSMMKRKRATL